MLWIWEAAAWLQEPRSGIGANRPGDPIAVPLRHSIIADSGRSTSACWWLASGRRCVRRSGLAHLGPTLGGYLTSSLLQVGRGAGAASRGLA
jgi:hypothetical protein